MTCDDFREIVLALPGVEERSHMGHPDFRTNGKIFASIPDDEKPLAMLKVTPDQQDELVKNHPVIFRPCNGSWGLDGATYVELSEASRRVVVKAAKLAWERATGSTKR